MKYVVILYDILLRRFFRRYDLEAFNILYDENLNIIFVFVEDELNKYGGLVFEMEGKDIKKKNFKVKEVIMDS